MWTAEGSSSTTKVFFFAERTLELQSSVDLPLSPTALTPSSPAEGRFAGETQQIVKIQANNDQIVTEVSTDRRFQGPPSLQTGRVLESFDRSGSHRLLSSHASTPEFGTLVEQVGAPTDDVFFFSIRDGKTRILRR